MQHDVVVRTFLTKYPNAVSHTEGIDESSPLKASIVYKNNDEDKQTSLIVYVRGEGTVSTDCFSPITYTFKHDVGDESVTLQYYYHEKQLMIDFLNDNIMSSPLKQFKSGSSFNEIKCKENLTLLQKYDGSPACVKSETEEKLIERGWAKPA